MRGWQVELNDGSIFSEWSIKSQIASLCEMYGWLEEPPWIILKKYLDIKNLKIISLQLKFDHQTVFLPRHSKTYFYSKRVEAFFGGRDDQSLYYGVGASDRDEGQVEITWYDGNNSKIEFRKVDKNDKAFICT
jgi:hypothetical protein